MTRKNNPRFYDRNEIKLQSYDRASEILAIAGLDASYIDGRHHNCLACGKKKLRISNRKSMAGGCDGCGLAWTNGADFLADQLGINPSDAFKLVADRLGIGRPGTKTSFPVAKRIPSREIVRPVGQSETIELAEDGFSKHVQTLEILQVPNQLFLALFAGRNAISIETLQAFGAITGKWKQFEKSKPQTVIGIPIYSKHDLRISNYTIYSATGGDIRYREKDESGNWIDKGVRKRAAFSGSDRVGVTLPLAMRNEILHGNPIESAVTIKTEGITDCLALHSLAIHAAEERVAVWTNTDGARSTNVAKWFLPMLAKLSAKTHVIIHDRDEAGEDGAKSWAYCLQSVGPVKIVALDLPYSKHKGKDLRDYIASCNGDAKQKFQMLSNVISSTPHEQKIQEPPGKGASVSDYNRYDFEHPDDPHRLARLNLESYEKNAGGKLVYWQGQWMKYRGGVYRSISDGELRSKVSQSVYHEFERVHRLELADYESKPKAIKQKTPSPKMRKVTQSLISNVLGALQGICLIPSSIEMQCWIPDRSKRNYITTASEIICVDKFLQNKPCSEYLLPHSSDWFSCSKLNYSFDLTAKPERWLRYMDYAMDGDESRINILQEWAGYLLWPSNELQKFLVLEGEGGNGKNVFLAGMEAMIGSDNCSFVSLEQFGERFALSSTLGKIVNISSDVGELDGVAEGVLKQFSAGDRMQFDMKNKTPISARPTAKLICAWNTRPRIKDKSRGLWRRLVLVPFDRVVSPEDRVPGMDTPRWWSDHGELPGILNWALLGLHRLRSQGRFTESERCNQVLADYAIDSNPAATFLSEYLRISHREEGVPCRRLYELYRYWCEQSGHKPLSDNSFGKEVKRAFPNSQRTRTSARAETRAGIESSRIYIYSGIEFSVETILDEPVLKPTY